MTNRKSTKRALLGSVMAMVLCLAMLVGATFAWFTDTASTGVNKIQAGPAGAVPGGMVSVSLAGRRSRGQVVVAEISRLAEGLPPVVGGLALLRQHKAADSRHRHCRRAFAVHRKDGVRPNRRWQENMITGA